MKFEELQNLPKKESRKEYLTRKFGNMWDIPKFDHSWLKSEKSDYPEVKAKWVLKKYLGKSFDDAFSYYCTLVEKHEQSVFLEMFKERRWRFSEYTIDSQKRIQFVKGNLKKNPIKFFSIDYSCGYYNITTKQLEMSYPYYKDMNNYIKVILSGYEKTFKTKKDPEYQKLMAEKIRAEKRNKKLLKKQEEETIISFLKEDNNTRD